MNWWQWTILTVVGTFCFCISLIVVAAAVKSMRDE